MRPSLRWAPVFRDRFHPTISETFVTEEIDKFDDEDDDDGGFEEKARLWLN